GASAPRPLLLEVVGVDAGELLELALPRVLRQAVPEVERERREDRPLGRVEEVEPVDRLVLGGGAGRDLVEARVDDAARRIRRREERAVYGAVDLAPLAEEGGGGHADHLVRIVAGRGRRALVGDETARQLD